MKIATLACIAVAASVFCTSADAATFRYSYLFNTGDLLTGTLDGTVQGDANTIVVNGVGLPSINGNPFPADSNVLYSDNGDVTGSATVTFDGSVIDFVVANASKGNGFNLNSTLVPVGIAAFMLPSGLASVTGHVELYDPKAWSIAQIPLPASLLMLLSGIAGLFVVRRKSTTAA